MKDGIQVHRQLTSDKEALRFVSNCVTPIATFVASLSTSARTSTATGMGARPPPLFEGDWEGGVTSLLLGRAAVASCKRRAYVKRSILEVVRVSAGSSF